MGFEFFKNHYGNVLPNSKNNIGLIKQFRKLTDYDKKLSFWDKNNLQFINYVLRDMTENDEVTYIEGSNFTINPEDRSEWVKYYEWQRDKGFEQMKFEFEATLSKLTHKTQKEEFKIQILSDIEEKLKILNPNAIYNERRDTKYAYDCEVKGQTPFRKQFNFQTDSATIKGGALYCFKHYVLQRNFNDKPQKQNLKFVDLFHNPDLEQITFQLFKDLKVINNNNHFIKINKGFFPFWIKWCRENNIVKTELDNIVYRNALVEAIPSLTLSKKFVEFNTSYKLLDTKTWTMKFISHYSKYLHK